MKLYRFQVYDCTVRLYTVWCVYHPKSPSITIYPHFTLADTCPPGRGAKAKVCCHLLVNVLARGWPLGSKYLGASGGLQEPRLHN